MERLRRSRHAWGWVALLALLAQLALTSGDVHPLPSAHSDHVLATSGGPGAAPDGPATDHDDHDAYCAACAILALIAAGAAANPPALPPPVLSAPVVAAAPAPALPRARSHAGFRPRAPPVA